MAWLAHLKHAPPRMLPYRIWSCYVTGCRHKYGNLKNWGAPRPRPLEWNVAAPYKHTSPTLKLVALGQTTRAIRRKNCAPRFLPFKVIQGHRN